MKRAAELYDFEAMMIALDHHRRKQGEQFEGLAVPAAAKKNMGIVAMKVFRPREKVEDLDPKDLFRYALTLEHFACANVGTDSMEVLRANLNTVRNFKPLSPTQMKDLSARIEPFYRNKAMPWMQSGYVDGLIA